MTEDAGRAGLTAGEKEALLAGLRRASRSRTTVRPAAPRRTEPAAAAAAFDFAALPEAKQFRVARAAAELLGIDNPFFRAHDGIAGATTSIGGRRFVNFASYNYLGLNGHPAVTAAAKAAIDTYGTSVSASRLVAGERPVHRALERSLAALHGTEDAVAMVSGHATNVTTIGTLAGPRDLVLADALAHNSVAEGARLSGARRLTFPHNDWRAAAELLGRTRGDHGRVIIAIEALYSMDGDMPDLAAFVRVAREHAAWLMVDEAHSMGVLGRTGRGIAEEQGVDPGAVEIWMGTLSKTFCACGGYIAGSTALVELLKASAPGFVFSVGMPAPLAAAARAAIGIMEREPERTLRLQANGRLFLTEARAAGLDTATSAGFSVVPVIVGDSVAAALLAHRLNGRGINVAPIIHPAVPEQQARLRFFITSEHTPAQIREAVTATAEELAGIRAEGPALAQLAAAFAEGGT